jgi:hypothetical protein
MLGLLRPLEQYVGPTILTVDALGFVVSLGCMLKVSLELSIFHSKNVIFLL